MQSIIFTNQDIQKAQMFDNFHKIPKVGPGISSGTGDSTGNRTQGQSIDKRESFNQSNLSNGPGTSQQHHAN